MARYPRLGVKDASWLDYEYQVSWSLKGNNVFIKQPTDPNKWLKSTGSSVVLVPPFKKRVIELDLDRALMKEREIASANVRFFVILNQQPQAQKSMVLKPEDANPTVKFALYHDPAEPVAYQVIWYGKNGKVEEPLQEWRTGESYLNLSVPDKVAFK